MRRIGFHTSIAGGLPKSIERIAELGCNTLQIFTHNPRGWALKDIPQEDLKEFVALRNAHDVSPVFIHTSYLVNPASNLKSLRKKSEGMIRYELDVADRINAEYVILHPGSAKDDDPRSGRKRVIESLVNISKSGKWRARLLLENTAGQRGDITSKIWELAEIMEKAPSGLVSGICLDTCHAFSAGYDVRLRKGLRAMSNEITRYLGKNAVKLVHLNDSKNPVGSGVDRHEHIGKGKIGRAGMKNLLTYSEFEALPVILETPKKTKKDDVNNLRVVRRLLGIQS